MYSSVGFLLLTHANPPQILRLVDRLDQLFKAPPVAIHHDFYQCPLPESEFPQNVSFVRPHLQTTWARFSCVEATVRGFRALLERRDCPDWIVLLSGADYPIKPAYRVLEDLTRGNYDAHIQCNLIDKKNLTTLWHRKCFSRYCTTPLLLPSLSKTLKLRKRLFQARLPFYTSRNTPFRNGFRCYAGPQWFCIGRRAAEYVVDFHENKRVLREHYSPIYFPEESYFQTILANAPNLRINQKDWRFIVMEDVHPKTFVHSDLPGLLASDAHFARKFNPDVDSLILDELDKVTAQTITV